MNVLDTKVRIREDLDGRIRHVEVVNGGVVIPVPCTRVERRWEALDRGRVSFELGGHRVVTEVIE